MHINKDVIVATVLLGLLYFCYRPMAMSSELEMLMHALLIVVFMVFAVFVYREEAADEREAAHKAHADRVAYLLGATTLLAGTLYQGIVEHAVDPWLPITLSVMILAKIITRWRLARCC